MRIEAHGIEGAIAEIEGIAERAANLSPVMQAAAADTNTLIGNSFRRLVSPDGSRWETLKAETIKRRRQGRNKNARKSTPLDDTGIMKNSSNASFTSTVLKFGSNVPYAVYHQFGSGRMHRPFLPVEKGGAGYVLMTGGPAGRHWRDVRDMVIEYIRTGRITE